MRQSVITEVVRTYVPDDILEEQWDLRRPGEGAGRRAGSSRRRLAEWSRTSRRSTDEEILERMRARRPTEAYQAKVDLVGAEQFHQFERKVLLQSLDSHWREHLAALDYLRQGIHLRGYAQKNPKQEYKREAFELFETLLDYGPREVTRIVFTVQIRSPEDVEEAAPHADVQQRPIPARRTMTRRWPAGRSAGPAALRPRLGPRSAATIPAPAVQARNTSTATEQLSCILIPRHPTVP